MKELFEIKELIKERYFKSWYYYYKILQVKTHSYIFIGWTIGILCMSLFYEGFADYISYFLIFWWIELFFIIISIILRIMNRDFYIFNIITTDVFESTQVKEIHSKLIKYVFFKEKQQTKN